MGLAIVPCTLTEAHAFVAAHHRHHRPSRGGLWALAVADTGRLVDGAPVVVGVAVVGRPVARQLSDGWTAEVTRLATDGTRNACSMLYGAAWRAARALGWRKLITYTLPKEGGASLRAAGWTVVGETKSESWNRENRPRVDKHPTQAKLRWEAPCDTAR